MSFSPGQRLQLLDGQGQPLGQVVVERTEGDWVFGQFTAGPAFARLEPLFAEYVEAANEQLLGRVGELDELIASHHLRLHSSTGKDLSPIWDVQIGDGVITFRAATTDTEHPLSVGTNGFPTTTSEASTGAHRG